MEESRKKKSWRNPTEINSCLVLEENGIPGRITWEIGGGVFGGILGRNLRGILEEVIFKIRKLIPWDIPEGILYGIPEETPWEIPQLLLEESYKELLINLRINSWEIPEVQQEEIIGGMLSRTPRGVTKGMPNQGRNHKNHPSRAITVRAPGWFSEGTPQWIIGRTSGWITR